MKFLMTTFCVLLFCFKAMASQSASNQTADTSDKVDACSSCHNSIINLKGRGVDLIIKQTKAIQSAEKPHPPAGIKDLCDEDIAAIAEFLDKA